MEEWYPLYLHDLSDKERALIVEIFQDARTLELVEQARLESQFGETLRYVLGAAKEGAATRKVETEPKAKRATHAHIKWVRLYNYIMSTLHDHCETRIKQLTETTRGPFEALRSKIGRLHQLGLNSGRYDTDMHLFNKFHMDLDSQDTELDPALEEEAYLGFRYHSTGGDIIVTLMRIAPATPYSGKVGEDTSRQRRVFEAHVLDKGVSRTTRGLAYKPGNFVYLFGFLDTDNGAEFFSLRSGDNERTVMVGIVNTIDKDGNPHAKQCLFVKLSEFYPQGAFDTQPRIKDAVIAKLVEDKSRWLERREDGEWFIHRYDGKPIIRLSVYLSPTIEALRPPSVQFGAASENDPKGPVY